MPWLVSQMLLQISCHKTAGIWHEAADVDEVWTIQRHDVEGLNTAPRTCKCKMMFYGSTRFGSTDTRDRSVTNDTLCFASATRGILKRMMLSRLLTRNNDEMCANRRMPWNQRLPICEMWCDEYSICELWCDEYFAAKYIYCLTRLRQKNEHACWVISSCRYIRQHMSGHKDYTSIKI